ncbi:hypothetical protein EW146_g8015 [Bondarzewia mesenterica]|uniref:Thioredoxin domain-containing protein n=1 Tax=Bondarzewia mesenterica TaxID=1095465 RepID=A0A4S4LIC1_9AGAM|nr:hypothetical protein EW146_g8015 [Bondarzewia mesenterica]
MAASTIEILSGNFTLPSCIPHLMPFHIAHTGPTPVSTYLRVKAASLSLPLPPRDFLPSEKSTEVDPNTLDCAKENAEIIKQTDDPTSHRQDAGPSTPTAKRFVSAVRGRAIQGLEVQLPKGYSGLVLRGDSRGDIPDSRHSKLKENGNGRAKGKRATRKSAKAMQHEDEDEDIVDQDHDGDGGLEGAYEGAVRVLKPTAQFESFVLWHPDIPVDEGRDEYLRSLTEWVGLAAEVTMKIPSPLAFHLGFSIKSYVWFCMHVCISANQLAYPTINPFLSCRRLMDKYGLNLLAHLTGNCGGSQWRIWHGYSEIQVFWLKALTSVLALPLVALPPSNLSTGTIMLPQLLALSLAIAPSLVSAGLFPKDSLVKHLDAKGFRQALKENVAIQRTSVVAFVAPWCGHCQKMVPELNKAALGLYPLIPTYAVDCDDAKNRQVCAEQGVKGFPTIKLFPRGREVEPITFEGERTASSFYYWAIRRIPHKNKKIYYVEDVQPWVTKDVEKNRVLLLNKSKNVPMLWHVLANKYRDQLGFGSHRDRKGRSSKALGFEPGDQKDSKVLVYPADQQRLSSSKVRQRKGRTISLVELMGYAHAGILKYDSLCKFFDSVIDGTADLTVANEQAKAEDFEFSEEELEIQRKQEAQRMALAHGGFSDMIDFEEAIKKHGPNFHDAHGYAGVMGDIPKKDMGGKAEKEENPIQKILKHQQEMEKKKAQKESTPKTGAGGQIVFEAKTETGHPQTGAVKPTVSTSETLDATASPELEVEPASASSVVEAVSEGTNSASSNVPDSSGAPLAEDAISTSASGETTASLAEPVEVEESGHVKDEL